MARTHGHLARICGFKSLLDHSKMSIDSSIGYTNHPGSKARDFQLLGEQMFHHVPLRWLAHHVHLQNGGSNPNYEEYVGRPQCHSPSSYLQLCSGTHVDFA